MADTHTHTHREDKPKPYKNLAYFAGMAQFNILSCISSIHEVLHLQVLQDLYSSFMFYSTSIIVENNTIQVLHFKV